MDCDISAAFWEWSPWLLSSFCGHKLTHDKTDIRIYKFGGLWVKFSLSWHKTFHWLHQETSGKKTKSSGTSLVQYCLVILVIISSGCSITFWQNYISKMKFQYWSRYFQKDYLLFIWIRHTLCKHEYKLCGIIINRGLIIIFRFTS